MQRLIGGGAFLDENLHERAGFGRAFPRKSAFAAGEAHHYVADAARFARLQHQVLGQVVALVEQADGRHPVFHRGAVFAFDHGRGGLIGNGLGNVGGGGLRVFTAARTGGQQQ